MGKRALGDWAKIVKNRLNEEIKSSKDPSYVRMLELVEAIEETGPPTPQTEKVFNELVDELEIYCTLDKKHIISWCDKPNKERHPDTRSKRRDSQLVGFKF